MRRNSFIIFILTLFLTAPLNAAVTTLRIAGNTSSESYTYNFTLTPGDTVDFGVWLNTDTTVDEVKVFLNFDSDVLQLLDLDAVRTGVNLLPDTTTFDNVVNDSAEYDTIDYNAKTGIAFTGDTRVATMRFRARTISATIPIIWSFNAAASRQTEIDSAGTDKLTGVDTAYIYIKPDSVLNLRGYVDAATPGTGMVLSWTASSDTGVNGYLIYRATFAKQFSRIYGLVTAVTTFTDTMALLGNNYFWKVSAADSDAAVRAESDLSDSTTAPHSSISKAIYKVSLGAKDTATIPGSSMLYELILQNDGFDTALNVLLDDDLDTRHVTFDTNVVVPASWAEWYAHKETPDRSYSSADFDTAYSNVFWVRFKNDTVALGDSFTFRIRVKVK